MSTSLDYRVIIATLTTTTTGGSPAGLLLIDGDALPVTVRSEIAGQSPGGLVQKLLDDGLGQPGVVTLCGPVAVPA
jgi:hypothetical protein